MINKDFAVFILSHGRPDNVITYKTLQKVNYTGKVFIVIDNEDKSAGRYFENFGDKVIMFDKAAIAETFDEGDNFQDRRAVIYARNACFSIAKEIGVTYFLELDDDYTYFAYGIDGGFNSQFNVIRQNLENIFEFMLNYYKSIPAKSIAFAQGGDFIGGPESNGILESINRRRKCMNSFFCSTERPFQFVGRINEDVNIYTWFQSLGNLFLTFPLIRLNQKVTQQSQGGMTELYLDSGTYIKSFYTVMYQPSSVRVGMIINQNRRLHHLINWDCTVPCIISEQYRKASRVTGETL